MAGKDRGFATAGGMTPQNGFRATGTLWFCAVALECLSAPQLVFA